MKTTPDGALHHNKKAGRAQTAALQLFIHNIKRKRVVATIFLITLLVVFFDGIFFPNYAFGYNMLKLKQF